MVMQENSGTGPQTGKDFAAGLVIFTVASAALVESIRMPVFDEGLRGQLGAPGLTPALLAAGLVLMSLLLMARSRHFAFGFALALPTSGTWRIIVMFGLAALYAYVMPIIGFTLATFATLCIFQIAFARRVGFRYILLVAVLLSAVVAVALKLVFSEFFFVPLPGELL